MGYKNKIMINSYIGRFKIIRKFNKKESNCTNKSMTMQANDRLISQLCFYKRQNLCKNELKIT